MARVPSGEVAGSRILRRYVHRISVVPQGRTSFACKFLTSFQFHVLPRNYVPFYAKHLLGPVTLAEAEIHSKISCSPLAADLAITKSDHWLACAAVAIFLRKEDKVFGNFFDRLPAADNTAIKNSRKMILQRVRFYLTARPDQALRDIAQARPTINRTSRDPGSYLEGFGAARFGVTGFSHLARELLLFILIDTLLRATDNTLIRQEALDVIINNPPAQTLDEESVTLFDSVLLPFFTDIGMYSTRATMALHIYTDYAENIPENNDPNNCDTSPPTVRQIERISGEIREKELIFADPATKATERQHVERQLFRLKQHKAAIAGRMLAARKSRPLPCADSGELDGELELLVKFVDSVEEYREHLPGPHKRECMFKHVFRLRFAMALLSFRRKEKFTAKAQVDVLSKLFDLESDTITDNALAFIQGNSAREPWGVARSDGRYFYGVLNKLAEEHLCTQLSSLETVRDVGMESLLAAIDADLQKASAQYRSRPMTVNAANWETDLYLWALQTELGLHPRDSGGLGINLRTLCGNLTDLLVASPNHGLLYCVSLANEALPKHEMPLGPPPEALKDREAYLDRIMELLEDSDRLAMRSSHRSKFALILLAEVVTQLCEKEDRTSSVSDREKTPSNLIFQFFTEKYAASQSVADQERWELLAYRLTQVVKTPVYTAIYERVSRECVADLPSPLKLLRATYDNILKRPDFQIAISGFCEKFDLPTFQVGAL